MINTRRPAVDEFSQIGQNYKAAYCRRENSVNSIWNKCNRTYNSLPTGVQTPAATLHKEAGGRRGGDLQLCSGTSSGASVQPAALSNQVQGVNSLGCIYNEHALGLEEEFSSILHLRSEDTEQGRQASPYRSWNPGSLPLGGGGLPFPGRGEGVLGVGSASVMGISNNSRNTQISTSRCWERASVSAWQVAFPQGQGHVLWMLCA